MPEIARPLGTEQFVLSEGPVWDPGSASLTWVDIEAGCILTARWADGALAAPTIVDVGEYVGCAIPLGHGRVLAALTRQLGIVEADGTIRRSRELIPAGTRFNDGKIDPQGRLVVGTISLEEAYGEVQSLQRLEYDGAITVLDDDLLLANGLGWSPDGRTLYSVDTLAETIYRRDYGADAIGDRSPFVVGALFDGMTVDSRGNLWVAVWGAGEVRCFDPAGAPVPDRAIRVAAPHTSSVTFAGAAVDVAVITSASRDLTEAERLRWPDAGGLFSASGCGVGLPPTPWREADLPI